MCRALEQAAHLGEFGKEAPSLAKGLVEKLDSEVADRHRAQKRPRRSSCAAASTDKDEMVRRSADVVADERRPVRFDDKLEFVFVVVMPPLQQPWVAVLETAHDADAGQLKKPNRDRATGSYSRQGWGSGALHDGKDFESDQRSEKIADWQHPVRFLRQDYRRLICPYSASQRKTQIGAVLALLDQARIRFVGVVTQATASSRVRPNCTCRSARRPMRRSSSASTYQISSRWVGTFFQWPSSSNRWLPSVIK